MSNQEYYQSFQQESNLDSTGATSAGLNINSHSEPPPYRNDFEQNNLQGISGQHASSGDWDKNELIPDNQEQPYRSSNNQNYIHEQGVTHSAEPSEEQRGLAGAALGGAAGGLAGHQKHHGFIGTVGGAIIGSVAESAMKKYKKSEERPETRYNNNQSSDGFGGKESRSGRGARGGRGGRGRGRGLFG